MATRPSSQNFWYQALKFTKGDRWIWVMRYERWSCIVLFGNSTGNFRHVFFFSRFLFFEVYPLILFFVFCFLLFCPLSILHWMGVFILIWVSWKWFLLWFYFVTLSIIETLSIDDKGMEVALCLISLPHFYPRVQTHFGPSLQIILVPLF